MCSVLVITTSQRSGKAILNGRSPYCSNTSSEDTASAKNGLPHHRICMSNHVLGASQKPKAFPVGEKRKAKAISRDMSKLKLSQQVNQRGD